MRALGFDLGTKTGFGVIVDGVPFESGVLEFAAPLDHKGRRYASALDHFITLFGKYKPDVVGYEIVRRHSGTHAAHVYGGMRAALLIAAYRFGVEVLEVGVGAVKTRATGKGNAGKKAMQGACKARLGIVPVDDNHADGLWVAVCTAEAHGDRVADLSQPRLPGVP